MAYGVFPSGGSILRRQLHHSSMKRYDTVRD